MKLSSRNIMCIFCLAICAILWVWAPFVAINILTMGDQPSAMDFITDNITYLGELKDVSPFWAAVTLLIGIIISLICAVAKKCSAVRFIAIVLEMPMLWVMKDMFLWAEGNMDDFFEMFGYGYWGILVLLLIVIGLSGKNAKMKMNDSEQGNQDI